MYINIKDKIKNDKQTLSVTYIKSDKHLWIKDAKEPIFEMYQGKIIKIKLKPLKQHIEQLLLIADPEFFKNE